MKHIGHNSKVGCVLNVDMKPEVPRGRSVYAHVLTNHGSTWNLNGRYFDGIDDYVDCGNKNSLNITDGVTVIAWVKINNFNNNYMVIVEKSFTSATSPYFDFTLAFSGTTTNLKKTPRFRIDTTQALSPEALEIDVWYHLAGTYDKQNIKLYINGVLKKTTVKTTSINTSGENLYIGKSHYYPGRQFNGFIDSIPIYNHALSPEKIKSHYLNTKNIH